MVFLDKNIEPAGPTDEEIIKKELKASGFKPDEYCNFCWGKGFFRKIDHVRKRKDYVLCGCLK